MITTKLTLLIVPYGIETYFKCSLCDAFFLLIVPYGIETLLRSNIRKFTGNF